MIRIGGAALLACILLLGCSGNDDSETSSEPSGDPIASSIEIKQVDAASLPIASQLPPGVSPRIRISAPREWSVPGRKSGYLAWFLRYEASQVPLIYVKEEDGLFTEADTIDEDSAHPFADFVARRHAADEQEPLERLVILKMGDYYFVRSVLSGKVRDTLLERQILETQVNGRSYVIELRVLPGELTKFRDAGYAVAASIEFIEPNDTAEDNVSPDDNGTQDTGDGTSNDKTANDETANDETGNDETGNDETGNDETGDANDGDANDGDL